MITKQMLEEPYEPKLINNYGYHMFLSDLRSAESYAVSNFKIERTIHKDIRYLKIEINGEYPKEWIVEAVNNYRKSWRNVNFYISNKTPGSYEPTQKWIIKIDTKE